MSRYLPVLLLSVVATGCHLKPELGPPGTIGTQRTRAVLNDPFPIDELGPEILGGRPRGFDLPEPRAEGLQKYSPPPVATPAYNPYQISPQPIVPFQPVPTAAVPTQLRPHRPVPIQTSPVQPGLPARFAP